MPFAKSMSSDAEKIMSREQRRELGTRCRREHCHATAAKASGAQTGAPSSSKPSAAAGAVPSADTPAPGAQFGAPRARNLKPATFWHRLDDPR